MDNNLITNEYISSVIVADDVRNEEIDKAINDSCAFGAGFISDGKHINYSDVIDANGANEAVDVAPFISELQKYL